MTLSGFNKSKDLIAIIAPSSPFTRQLLLDGIEKMKSYDFKIIYDERIFKRGWGNLPFFVGSPEERAFEIMEYFKDPDVKAIISSRGGYGSNLVAQYLDYEIIEKNPKVFMGFSDLTYLLNTINSISSITTFHGPMLGSYQFLSMENYDFDVFKKIIENPYYQIEVSISTMINSKRVEGIIIGGNLTLLTTMLGTNHDISYENKILFIEDTNEAPYKIDRNLTHLKQAGKLDSLKAIVFGEMLACGTSNETIINILNNLGLKIPIILNFPAGHGERNVIVPIGGNCIIESKSKKITMFARDY